MKLIFCFLSLIFLYCESFSQSSKCTETNALSFSKLYFKKTNIPFEKPKIIGSSKDTFIVSVLVCTFNENQCYESINYGTQANQHISNNSLRTGRWELKYYKLICDLNGNFKIEEAKHIEKVKN